MADLVVVPTSTKQDSGGQQSLNKEKTAAATLTAAQSAYLNGSSKWDLADADGAGSATADTAGANEIGIIINPAALDQPVVVAKDGAVLDLGVSANKDWYVVSPNAPGGIAPYGDLTTGDYITLLGYGRADGKFVVKIVVTGLTKT